MKNYLFSVSLTVVALFSTSLFAEEECHSTASVSGSVSTINVSEVLQVGTIHMQLISDKNGHIIFDETGAIVGRVTSRNDTGGSTLDHNIFFADGSTIETSGDVAQIQYPVPLTSKCSFQVEETISNFWGTRLFKRATGSIDAVGTISFPPCDNQNSFELSGTICLK